MVIGIITADLDSRGGWGRYATHLVDGLKRQGHRVLVCTEDGGDQSIIARGFGIFLSALRVAYFFRRVDIIHALDVYPFGIIAWIASALLRKPFILSAQGTYSIAPLHRKWFGFFARLACRSAWRIIAISRYTASLLVARVPDARVIVIPHGIDVDAYRVTADQESRALQVLSVGALKWRKGYHIALEAFARVLARVPSARYVIVGSQRDVGYTAKLRSLVESLGISSSVEFIEGCAQDELRALYARSRLFVLPSMNQGWHFEGFGLVFLEAAASGLPVVGTLGNGITDAVDDGRNGLLVPQGDVDATASAMEKLLCDEELWRRMSSHSIVWAKRHSVDGMMQEYKKVYDLIE